MLPSGRAEARAGGLLQGPLADLTSRQTGGWCAPFFWPWWPLCGCAIPGRDCCSASWAPISSLRHRPRRAPMQPAALVVPRFRGQTGLPGQLALVNCATVPARRPSSASFSFAALAPSMHPLAAMRSAGGDETASLLSRCIAGWGRRVIHVFDRGFAGTPWPILRWPTRYHLADARGHVADHPGQARQIWDLRLDRHPGRRSGLSRKGLGGIWSSWVWCGFQFTMWRPIPTERPRNAPGPRWFPSFDELGTSAVGTSRDRCGAGGRGRRRWVRRPRTSLPR